MALRGLRAARRDGGGGAPAAFQRGATGRTPSPSLLSAVGEKSLFFLVAVRKCHPCALFALQRARDPSAWHALGPRA